MNNYVIYYRNEKVTGGNVFLTYKDGPKLTNEIEYALKMEKDEAYYILSILNYNIVLDVWATTRIKKFDPRALCDDEIIMINAENVFSQPFNGLTFVPVSSSGQGQTNHARLIPMLEKIVKRNEEEDMMVTIDEGETWTTLSEVSRTIKGLVRWIGCCYVQIDAEHSLNLKETTEEEDEDPQMMRVIETIIDGVHDDFFDNLTIPQNVDVESEYIHEIIKFFRCWKFSAKEFNTHEWVPQRIFEHLSFVVRINGGVNSDVRYVLRKLSEHLPFARSILESFLEFGEWEFSRMWERALANFVNSHPNMTDDVLQELLLNVGPMCTKHVDLPFIRVKAKEREALSCFLRTYDAGKDINDLDGLKQLIDSLPESEHPCLSHLWSNDVWDVLLQYRFEVEDQDEDPVPEKTPEGSWWIRDYTIQIDLSYPTDNIFKDLRQVIATNSDDLRNVVGINPMDKVDGDTFKGLVDTLSIPNENRRVYEELADEYIVFFIKRRHLLEGHTDEQITRRAIDTARVYALYSDRVLNTADIQRFWMRTRCRFIYQHRIHSNEAIGEMLGNACIKCSKLTIEDLVKKAERREEIRRWLLTTKDPCHQDVHSLFRGKECISTADIEDEWRRYKIMNLIN